MTLDVLILGHETLLFPFIHRCMHIHIHRLQIRLCQQIFNSIPVEFFVLIIFMSTSLIFDVFEDVAAWYMAVLIEHGCLGFLPFSCDGVSVVVCMISG